MNQTTCQTCAGFGVVSGTSGSISCPTCLGKGIWLTLGTKTGVFDLPPLATPESPNTRSTKRVLTTSLKVGAFLLCLMGIVLVAMSNPADFVSLFWGPGYGHLLFGVGGLLSMWSLSHWKTEQSSSRNLYELNLDIEKSDDSPIRLNDYTNPRIAELFRMASYRAQTLRSSSVTDDIFLLTLLESPRILTLLARLEEPPTQFVEAFTKMVAAGNEGHVTSVSFQPVIRQRILRAFELSIEYKFPYVDLEDVLLAYAETPGTAADLFTQYGLTRELVYGASCWYAEEVERSGHWAKWSATGRIRDTGFMNKAWTALPTPYLDQFSVSLIQTAGSAGVATNTVRDAEISRVLEIMGSSHTANVVLVGDPGVGKSTVLGAVALRMLEDRVPEVLRDRRLLQVDLAALLQSGGKPEENLQRALNEVSQAGNVVLAIPDVQGVIGTSAGALDGGATLAGALRQGLIQIITTASYADYHRFIESNSTLSTLLTQVEVKPLTTVDTVRILEEEASSIEGRQHVFLTYQAIQTAATLAERYVPDQPLPGSAVGLLDEASSQVALSGGSWVTHVSVEQTIEKRTNIPVQHAGTEETEKLLHFEELLHRRVVGQEEAVSAVAEALRRSRAGLRNNKRPIASFMFVGPTGVGKTEMAKAVADLYFGGQGKIVRLDMSEYQDATSVYRLIGAPASNSDSYTEGGSLTQPIREHPFSLILLDELEKANPEVLNLFLQLLDDGRLTENTGRTVSFNNCIIIATSNAGSSELVQMVNAGTRGDELRKQSLTLLASQFKPEFINRFDAVVPFQTLTLEQVSQVAAIMLQDVVDVALKQGITVQFTPEAIQKLAGLGFDPQYGARPLRRVIQDKAEGLLAKLILEKQIGQGSTLQISADMIQ